MEAQCVALGKLQSPITLSFPAEDGSIRAADLYRMCYFIFSEFCGSTGHLLQIPVNMITSTPRRFRRLDAVLNCLLNSEAYSNDVQ